MESKALSDKKVIATARRFVCEKICFGCTELTVHVPHRKVLDPYTSRLAADAKAEEKKPGIARIVLMDSSGEVIRVFKKPPTAGALLGAMRQVEKENKLRAKLGGDADLSG